MLAPIPRSTPRIYCNSIKRTKCSFLLCGDALLLFFSSILNPHEVHRFPRVFGDEFGEEFGDKFGDDFSESLNLVMNLVENLATNLVIHQNW